MQTNIADIESRANSVLDGMTGVSRDRLAKDCLLLVAEVKKLREAAATEVKGRVDFGSIFGGAGIL